MKVSVTLDFLVEEEDLPALAELGWEAAKSQFATREEWDEYRKADWRSPHEFDLVEIIISRLFSETSIDAEPYDLEDAHTISR